MLAPILVLAVLITGCGNSDKPADPKPAAEQTLAAFTNHMRASNTAVDEFMGTIAQCIDTTGCARNESTRALKLVNASLQAAGPYQNAEPFECGQAFVLTRDGLAQQYKAVKALHAAAGNSSQAQAAATKLDAANDTIGQGISAIQTDC